MTNREYYMYGKILATLHECQLYKSCICKTGCIGNDAEGKKDSESGPELNGFVPVITAYIMDNDLQQATRAILNY